MLPSVKKKKFSSLLSLLYWSGLRGSNPPPSPWQGDALPNELNPRVFVFFTIEGQIIAYNVLYTIQEVLFAYFFFQEKVSGDPKGTRTPDL